MTKHRVLLVDGSKKIPSVMETLLKYDANYLTTQQGYDSFKQFVKIAVRVIEKENESFANNKTAGRRTRVLETERIVRVIAVAIHNEPEERKQSRTRRSSELVGKPIIREQILGTIRLGLERE